MAGVGVYPRAPPSYNLTWVQYNLQFSLILDTPSLVLNIRLFHTNTHICMNTLVHTYTHRETLTHMDTHTHTKNRKSKQIKR